MDKVSTEEMRKSVYVSTVYKVNSMIMKLLKLNY